MNKRNKKSSKEELLNKIKDDIIIYLKSGKLSSKAFELKDIDLNIEKEGLNKLLDIHFLLSEEVNSFMTDLKKNFKKFNTSTKKQENLVRGQIKGAVSWNKTFQIRNNINPKDKTIFVCNEHYKNFNTKENIVLKFFLEKIYSTIKNTDFKNYEEYDWFKKIEFNNNSLKDVYLKNLYLSKVNIDNFKLNSRILEDVSRNRNPLYNQAAKLLKKYKKLKELNKDTIKELLENTFIQLSDEAKLFELYWIFKIIKDNAQDKNLYVLESGNNKIAEWENNSLLYTMYHNSIGSKEFNFTVNVKEIEKIKNKFIKKQVEIIKKTKKLAKLIFKDLQITYENIYDGRPDIIIEIRKLGTNKLKKVIIGEVKHTTDRNYSIEGLRQLLEYCKLINIKKNKDTLQFISNEFEIEGILFLDNIDINESEFNNINILSEKDKKSYNKTRIKLRIITMKDRNKDLIINT